MEPADSPLTRQMNEKIRKKKIIWWDILKNHFINFVGKLFIFLIFFPNDVKE